MNLRLLANDPQNFVILIADCTPRDAHKWFASTIPNLNIICEDGQYIFMGSELKRQKTILQSLTEPLTTDIITNGTVSNSSLYEDIKPDDEDDDSLSLLSSGWFLLYENLTSEWKQEIIHIIEYYTEVT